MAFINDGIILIANTEQHCVEYARTDRNEFGIYAGQKNGYGLKTIGYRTGINTPSVVGIAYDSSLFAYIGIQHPAEGVILELDVPTGSVQPILQTIGVAFKYLHIDWFSEQLYAIAGTDVIKVDILSADDATYHNLTGPAMVTLMLPADFVVLRHNLILVADQTNHR